jgi:hypothetical protein
MPASAQPQPAHGSYLQGLGGGGGGGGPAVSNGLVYGFPPQDNPAYGSLPPVTAPVTRGDANPDAPSNGMEALVHMGHQPGGGFLNPYVSGHALVSGSFGAQGLPQPLVKADALPTDAQSAIKTGITSNSSNDAGRSDAAGQTPISPAPGVLKEEGVSAASGPSGEGAVASAYSLPKPDTGAVTYQGGVGGRMYPPIPPLRTGADGRPAYLMGSGFRGMPPPPGSAGAHLSSHLIPGTNIPYRNYSNTFPVKLFDLVSTEDEAVVGWQGHGTSFQVRNMDKFVNEVLPKHFKRKSF